MLSLNKILIGIILGGILLLFLFLGNPSGAKLNTPLASLTPHESSGTSESSPSPSPTPSMPSFQFNSSTDLQSELQKVDPKVSTNDFDGVNKTLGSF